MKYILVCGLSRGGSNLIWNALASRPGILLPRMEVNELLSTASIGLRAKIELELPSVLRWKANNTYNLTNKGILSAPALSYSKLLRQRINEETTNWIKLSQPKTLIEDYQIADISTSTHTVLKMVSSWSHSFLYGFLERNNPLKYLWFLTACIDVQSIVCLVRHPYAQAEAWMRRGCSQEMAFDYYFRYLTYYIELQRHNPQLVKLITLSSFLQDPFQFTSELISYCTGHNTNVSSIRISKKPTIAEATFKNSMDKQSQLYTQDYLSSALERNIEELHISRYLDSSSKIKHNQALNLYNSLLKSSSYHEV